MIHLRSIHFIAIALVAAAGCDLGQPTEPDATTDCPTWFEDADGDGHGGPVSRISCTQPAGFVESHDDCDDRAPDKHPGRREVCDELDNDCEPNTGEEAACTRACTIAVRPNGSRYMFCRTPGSAAEARAYCTKQEYELARVDDDDENNFLNVRSRVLLPDPTTSAALEVYLGGFARPDLTWAWADGTPFWSGGGDLAGHAVGGLFTAWALEEPSSAAGDGCLVQQADSLWNDTDCSTARPFVCERPRP